MKFFNKLDFSKTKQNIKNFFNVIKIETIDNFNFSRLTINFATLIIPFVGLIPALLIHPRASRIFEQANFSIITLIFVRVFLSKKDSAHVEKNKIVFQIFKSKYVNFAKLLNEILWFIISVFVIYAVAIIGAYAKNIHMKDYWFNFFICFIDFIFIYLIIILLTKFIMAYISKAVLANILSTLVLVLFLVFAIILIVSASNNMSFRYIIGDDNTNHALDERVLKIKNIRINIPSSVTGVSGISFLLNDQIQENQILKVAQLPQWPHHIELPNNENAIANFFNPVNIWEKIQNKELTLQDAKDLIRCGTVIDQANQIGNNFLKQQSNHITGLAGFIINNKLIIAIIPFLNFTLPVLMDLHPSWLVKSDPGNSLINPIFIRGQQANIFHNHEWMIIFCIIESLAFAALIWHVYSKYQKRSLCL